MQIALHANATTTPKTRAYIQQSTASVAELAAELGVSETTVRRWRKRTVVHDGSHVPKTPTTTLTPAEEEIICQLRSELILGLDDIAEVMQRCLRPDISRSAVYRCLKRHHLQRRPKPDAVSPRRGKFEETTAGFIHVDLKYLPALRRRKSYAFVAIDRATRFVHLEIIEKRSAEVIAACLARFLEAFPLPVHTILTDNGSEFTDRFAVKMIGKPEDKPSGGHPFDRLCAERGIEHRLTRPYSPQTNGMVERFNRRLADAIRSAPRNGRNAGRNRFDNHRERNAYITKFVHDYNRTRLKCLGYNAPLQTLNNLTKPYTQAGIHAWESNIGSAFYE